jgi:hypothetical protein
MLDGVRTLKLRFAFSWKRCFLALFLAPILGYLASVGVSKYLEPTPRYTLQFEPGEPKYAYPYWGNYLIVQMNRGRSRIWQVHRLSDGQFISEYDVEQAGDSPLPDTRGLPNASHRYQLSRFGHGILSWAEKGDKGPTLFDHETGKCHRFLDKTIDINDVFWTNRHGAYFVNVKAFPSLSLLPPQHLSVALPWLADWHLFPWDSRYGYWHRVIAAPDLREIYHAVFPTKVSGVSPSGHWLAVPLPVSQRQKRIANEPFGNYFVRFIDLQTGEVHDSIDSVTTDLASIVFLEESVILLTLRTSDLHLPALMHSTTGRLIEKFDRLSFTLYQPESCSVTREVEPKGYSYLKIDAWEKDSRSISAHFIDPEGNTSEIGHNTFAHVTDQKNCRGGQLYYYGDQASGWPSWIESKLGKDSYLFRLFLSFYYRRYNAVYDWQSGRDVMQWGGKWSGSPSFDGSLLVMCENAEDVYMSGGRNDLRRIVVYDLPLPVHSPWWAQGAGIAVFILLASSCFMKK